MSVLHNLKVLAIRKTRFERDRTGLLIEAQYIINELGSIYSILYWGQTRQKVKLNIPFIPPVYFDSNIATFVSRITRNLSLI